MLLCRAFFTRPASFFTFDPTSAARQLSGSYHEVHRMPEHLEARDLDAHVIRVIAQTQRIPVESISPDSTFEQLNIDSLDGINIIFAIENEFNINIPDDGVQNMRSVREVIEGVRTLIEEKTQAAPPGVA